VFFYAFLIKTPSHQLACFEYLNNCIPIQISTGNGCKNKACLNALLAKSILEALVSKLKGFNMSPKGLILHFVFIFKTAYALEFLLIFFSNQGFAANG